MTQLRTSRRKTPAREASQPRSECGQSGPLPCGVHPCREGSGIPSSARAGRRWERARIIEIRSHGRDTAFCSESETDARSRGRRRHVYTTVDAPHSRKHASLSQLRVEGDSTQTPILSLVNGASPLDCRPSYPAARCFVGVGFRPESSQWTQTTTLSTTAPFRQPSRPQPRQKRRPTARVL